MKLSIRKIAKSSLMLMAIMFFLYGCATVDYAKPYSQDSSPSNGDGFLYGRFKFTKKYMNLRLALGLTELTSKEVVNIRFHEDTGISIVPVKPGNYKVSHRVVALMGASAPRESNIVAFYPEGLTAPFQVEAGKAYYIGDYYGWTEFGQFQIIQTTFRGGIEKSEINFEQTTKELKTEYQNFSNVAFVNPWVGN